MVELAGSKRTARCSRPAASASTGASWEERGQAVRRGWRWTAPLLVRRYPRELSVPGLGPVGRSDLTATTVIRLRPVSHAEALRRVREDRAHTEAEAASLRSESDPRASTLRLEAEGTLLLEEELVARRTRLWDVLLGFAGRGSTETEARASLRGLQEALPELGFRFHPSGHRAAELTWALSVGGPLDPELMHAVPHEGLAALLPLWEDHLEEKDGVLLGVHARHGTPILTNRFRHPSHSSLIFGQTGSGKTYASALGWMRLRLFEPDLSIFVVDPLGGLAHVVRELGGPVLRVGAGTLALNPLDPATTGGNVRTKAARVGAMLRALFPSLTDEEVAILDTTLSGLFSRGGARPPGSVGTDPGVANTPRAPPRLSDLVAELRRRSPPPARLLTLLSTSVDGSLQGLDRSTDVDLSSRLLGFDLSAAAPSELPFFLLLILDLVYGEIRRRPGPKLIVVDEAHYLARAPGTAEFLDHLVRHVRHFQAGLELISQNPEDFLSSESGRSVLMNVDSTLLLRLKDGGTSLAEVLELLPDEIAFLQQASLPDRAGFSEAIWRCGTHHLPLAIVSSETENELLGRAFRSERVTARRPDLDAVPGRSPS